MNLKQYTSEHESGAALARKLGIPAVLISQWQTGVRRVPLEHCPAIERASNGLIRCEELRPDFDWAYLRATDCPTNREAA